MATKSPPVRASASRSPTRAASTPISSCATRTWRCIRRKPKVAVEHDHDLDRGALERPAQAATLPAAEELGDAQGDAPEDAVGDARRLEGHDVRRAEQV